MSVFFQIKRGRGGGRYLAGMGRQARFRFWKMVRRRSLTYWSGPIQRAKECLVCKWRTQMRRHTVSHIEDKLGGIGQTK